MFEALSGRSSAAPAPRRMALATALGLHAAVIAAAVLLTRITAAPPEKTFADPVLHFPRGPVKNPAARQPGPKDPTTKESSPKKPRPSHPRPPRSLPSDPASMPREHEMYAAPLAPDERTPASDPATEPATNNPLGAGDGGANEPGESGELAAAVCPAGAICSSANSDDVITFNSSMSRPRASCNPPAPLAPEAASEYGIEGRVVAQYVVHADGRADAVTILNNDAPPMFSEAVRDWLSHCSFTPAALDGAPRSVRIIQAFHFKSR